jgi:hypothetical protein
MSYWIRPAEKEDEGAIRSLVRSVKINPLDLPDVSSTNPFLQGERVLAGHA